jgi:hypothetical protein
VCCVFSSVYEINKIVVYAIFHTWNTGIMARFWSKRDLIQRNEILSF